MNELLTQYTPLILDFMVVAILLCGTLVRMHKGLYNALMPLAVIGASAICGLVLSAVLTGPISAGVAPAITKAVLSHEVSFWSLEDYDTVLQKLETGMPDEIREAINISKYAETAKDAAHDAGDKLAQVNEEVLSDENIDSAVSTVEDGLMDVAREALEERGLTGDAAREYIRTAGDALGSAGETVLTDENIDAAIAAVQKEMTTGTENLIGDGTEAREGRDAIRAAEDARAAMEAAVGAVIGFMVPRYVRVIVFLIGWVAFLAVLTTIKNSLGLVFNLPIVKQVDKLGGAALGFVETAVGIWLVLWTVRYLGFNVFRELARNTVVLRFLA